MKNLDEIHFLIEERGIHFLLTGSSARKLRQQLFEGRRRLINHTEISNDAQVARTTVHEYFKILQDTLIGQPLHPWGKTKKRKPVATDKFYFFDAGVVRFLQHRSLIQKGSPEFGEALETYFFHELKSFVDYTLAGDLHYWRSSSGFEVDFILAEQVAVASFPSKTLGEGVGLNSFQLTKPSFIGQ